MSEKYNKLSLEEIRELLLNGKLVHENMKQEDYAILIDNELEMPNPNNEVVRLCASALGKYDDYKALDKINIDVQNLIKSVVVVSKESRKFRKSKRVLIIAAAVFATLLATQLVASALGFDLFGYIFNWRKEQLVINYNVEHDDEEENAGEFESVYTTYENFSDIPSDIRSLVPQRINENLEFSFASIYIERSDKFSHTFKFINDDNVTLSLHIMKGTEIYIEKDDEYFEGYSVNGRDFTIYKNLEHYKVIWIDDGVLYDMGVNLTIGEVKSIINNI